MHEDGKFKPEILIAREDEFIKASLANVWERGLVVEKIAQKQYDFFRENGIAKLYAGVMTGLHPTLNVPMIGWERTVKLFNNFHSQYGLTELGSAFAAARCSLYIRHLPRFLKQFEIAKKYVEDETLAAVRVAMTTPTYSFSKDWAMKKVDAGSNEAIKLGITSQLAASIIGARHIDVLSPSIENIVKVVNYLKKELSLTEESAAMMAVKPIDIEDGLGRYVSPGGVLDLSRNKSIKAFRNMTTPN